MTTGVDQQGDMFPVKQCSAQSVSPCLEDEGSLCVCVRDEGHSGEHWCLECKHPFLARPAPHSEPTTSLEAAQALTGRAEVREEVFSFVRDRGDRGATAEEIQEGLDREGNTVRPRLWELTGQARGFPVRITKTEQRRQTKGHRSARVYVVA